MSHMCKVGIAWIALATVSAAQLVFEAPVVSVASIAGTGGINLDVGDVNGDGAPDVLFAGRDAGAELFINQGDGTFDAPVTVAMAAGSLAVEGVRLGDLDGDNDLDLVFTSGFRLQTALNDGSGNFGPQFIAYEPPIGGSALKGLLLADATGDEHLDLVVKLSAVTGADVIVIPGLGDGMFGLPLSIGFPPIFGIGCGTNETAVIHAADLNGDGIPDLTKLMADCTAPLGNSILYTYTGLGNGLFSPPVSQGFLGPAPYLTLADIDGDTSPDLVAGSVLGLGIALGDGNGGFGSFIIAPGSRHGYPTVADFDNDGFVDIAVMDTASGNADVAFFRGTGSGHFQQVLTVTGVSFEGGGTTASEVAAADFDGDGRTDLVLAGTSPPSLPDGVAMLRNHTYGPDTPFTDLGSALASVESGLPVQPIQLVAGSFVGGETVTFRLENVQHDEPATAWFVVGLSELSAPFAGGILIPDVDAVFGPLPLGASTALEFSGPMPLGLPTGLKIWTQFWIDGMSTPSGFAATTGVIGTTP